LSTQPSARSVEFCPCSNSQDGGTNGATSALLGLETAAPGSLAQRHAEQRVLLLYGLVFSLGGVPLIYMGDEYGIGNDHTAKHDPIRCIDGRWLQRAAFDHALADARHDTTQSAGRIFAGFARLRAARQTAGADFACQPVRLLQTDDPALLLFMRGGGQFFRPLGGG
jgi:amylosucrase